MRTTNLVGKRAPHVVDTSSHGQKVVGASSHKARAGGKTKPTKHRQQSGSHTPPADVVERCGKSVTGKSTKPRGAGISGTAASTSVQSSKAMSWRAALPQGSVDVGVVVYLPVHASGALPIIMKEARSAHLSGTMLTTSHTQNERWEDGVALHAQLLGTNPGPIRIRIDRLPSDLECVANPFDWRLVDEGLATRGSWICIGIPSQNHDSRLSGTLQGGRDDFGVVWRDRDDVRSRRRRSPRGRRR